ncbi:hypothetical protein RHABOEDO_001248 [Candidatus Rhabdochlamydia oedothoracis]|uniref:Uncharacterized protein n=1 Tax=Candidatus Rhabdochlamydia oedothoracis TaxID=2720720 RepID=A0ABX8V7K5_9BACT|nr:MULTISPECIES: transposase family protein [Rhabdochlamydia]KAG6559769.1 hypothetical protein RHOW815_000216 [Candidatus Rhabdochlamydia sp. W815]QYF48998.1 hypothetical protein RHABOEDO_001248 [Candidatus Rhabdochlamydia oedothoracis]
MEGFIHSSSIMMHFSKLPDPRKARNQLYSLHDIINIYPSHAMWTR